jgi:hypothetical protein
MIGAGSATSRCAIPAQRRRFMIPTALDWEALVRLPASVRCDLGPRRSGGVRTGELTPTRGPLAWRSLGSGLPSAAGVCA